MSPSIPRETDARISAALHRRLEAGSDFLYLDRYIECVLYDPEAGYYRRARERVGYRAGTDFYTASSLGEVFSHLVLASVRSLCPAPLRDHAFVEAGPESETGILGGIPESPFREHRMILPGETIEIPDKAVFFSNELFDAQPFRRFIRSGGAWSEIGVRLRDTTLQPVALRPREPFPSLPGNLPDGYTIDWPSGAHALLEQICRPDWKGLFLAFDYGLGRETVFRERPEGTGRTYAGHTMGIDFLQDAGQRDITCHMIWEEMEEILRRHRFTRISLEWQESFFMHHARPVIREILEAAPAGFSPAKQTLMELLHPDNMGHKFQVLSAIRGIG
ncbi:MAG: SAM-dependent methyltransferase [Oceanipulchritudo sp.]